MQCAFPASPRLSLAAQTAARCLMEEDVRAFPIRPLEIIRTRGWQVRTYTQTAARYDEQATSADVADMFGTRDAMASVRLKNGQPVRYLICYNDQAEIPERLTFSLAHEIGHILLGHFAFGQPDGLPEAQARLLDAEANAFAAALLAPAAVVAQLRSVNSGAGRHIFGLSISGWQVRLDTLTQEQHALSPALTRQLEAQFHTFMYRRQCKACGAIFLQKEACPACGCGQLQWVPEAGDSFPWTEDNWRSATFPADDPENPLADDALWHGDDKGI